MALTDKIKSFMSSPKGRQLMDRGQRELSKPENQQKIRKLLNRNRQK